MRRALKGLLDQRQQPSRRSDSFAQVGDPMSPYLRSDEATRYLRFTTAAAFRKWAARHGVPKVHRGRVLLYDRRVLDAFVSAKDWTKRHTA